MTCRTGRSRCQKRSALRGCWRGLCDAGRFCRCPSGPAGFCPVWHHRHPLVTLPQGRFGCRQQSGVASADRAARLVFARVLVGYFCASAGPKLDGLFAPSLGAYAKIFPSAFEAAGHDIGGKQWWRCATVVLAGGWAELVLPYLVVIGLLTRFAALGAVLYSFRVSPYLRSCRRDCDARCRV